MFAMQIWSEPNSFANLQQQQWALAIAFCELHCKAGCDTVSVCWRELAVYAQGGARWELVLMGKLADAAVGCGLAT